MLRFAILALVASLCEASHKAGFGCGQEFGERWSAYAERITHEKYGPEIEPNRARRSHTKLPCATFQKVPDFPALSGGWLIAFIGTFGAAPGASCAIGGPAAEMPFGAGAQAFFSASISAIGRA